MVQESARYAKSVMSRSGANSLEPSTMHTTSNALLVKNVASNAQPSSFLKRSLSKMAPLLRFPFVSMITSRNSISYAITVTVLYEVHISLLWVISITSNISNALSVEKSLTRKRATTSTRTISIAITIIRSFSLRNVKAVSPR